MNKQFSDMQFASQNYLERYLLNQELELAEFWADRLWNVFSDAHTYYLQQAVERMSFSEVIRFLKFVEEEIGDHAMNSTANTQFDLLMKYLYGCKR